MNRAVFIANPFNNLQTKPPLIALYLSAADADLNYTEREQRKGTCKDCVLD